MAVSRARRNVVRFSAVEDVKMDGLLFSRSVLQKELGFRPDQIDYLFAFPGGKVFEVIFTFDLFEQCLERFKERNDSAPLKVFSINALTQFQKRWVNVSMFNEDPGPPEARGDVAQTGDLPQEEKYGRRRCGTLRQGRPLGSARVPHTKPQPPEAWRRDLAAGTRRGSFVSAEDRRRDRRKPRTYGGPGSGAVTMEKPKNGKGGTPAGPSQRDRMCEKTGGTVALMQHTEGILAALQDSKNVLESQIATLAGEVGLLRNNHNKLKDRVITTEVTMQEMTPQVTPQVKALTQKITLMENEVRTLANKVEDAESRSRCHNIHLVGVPERAEGPSIELHIET
ncbi:hypothetical protein NDU88_001105 [Pleurodeles waltl]|uniref:Zinc finger CCHC domain-containing protein n=1 Tax=Pleurodeles waltl TaxID=8319 RepID=A0AAV7SAP7_PLEWA|nr:hypothetical protein NDU88_001105 [Pleurodeles waltl]